MFKEVESEMPDDRAYLDLKGARERISRAQTEAHAEDVPLLAAAVECVRKVECARKQRADRARRYGGPSGWEISGDGSSWVVVHVDGNGLRKTVAMFATEAEAVKWLSSKFTVNPE